VAFATLSSMDDAKLGRTIRVIRLRLGLTQRDLGRRARQSQQQISRLERGHLDASTLRALRAVVAAVGASLELRLRWRGPELDRLLDAEHAQIVAAVTDVLRTHGWEVLHEWTFNHYGERGAIDVVAWHPAARAILIVEVKSDLVDLQDLLGTLDRKARIAGAVLVPERGWLPAAVGRLVVVPEHPTLRAKVARHEAVLRPTLPARNREIRTWLRAPNGSLAGIWFVRTDRPGPRRARSGRRDGRPGNAATSASSTDRRGAAAAP